MTTKKIPFNKAPNSKRSEQYVKDCIRSAIISGDNVFTKKCHQWFEEKFNLKRCLLTTSGTHALELSALLCDIKEGDEVIMASYTFSSTANAFLMRGAKIVFVDIRPDTMNIDENKIEAAITKRTKVIVPMHYAGVSCEMKKILQIAKKYNLFVVEDAAQGVMSKYEDKYLGSIGDFGCYSFHETKNYSMGEGGAIIIDNKKFIERAEIIREKGTNRSKFFRGEVNKYGWMDIGSSYLPSDINAAYLYGQLEEAEELLQKRLELWNLYYKNLAALNKLDLIELANIPKNCSHNAHLFYIKTKNLQQRQKLINFLREKNIYSVFHYIPLHSSIAGKKFSKFHGKDVYTTIESERLLRLPLYNSLSKVEVNFICKTIKEFYGA